MLGMLGGHRGGVRRAEHELVAFAPTGPRGTRRGCAEALDGTPGERRIVAAPAAVEPLAHGSGAGCSRPPVERFVGPLDVFHFSDWMYPPQRGGLRTTTVHDLVPAPLSRSGSTPRTRRMHGREGRERREDVRPSSSRTRATPPTTSRRRSAFRRSGSSSRYPGIDAALPARGRGRPTSARRTCSPSRPSSRARTSATLVDGLRARCAQRPELELAVAGARGLGREPRARPEGVRPRSGTCPTSELPRALPRRRRVRLPLALRGLRDPGRRGDGVRDARRRLVAPVAGRGQRRRGRPRRPGRARRRSRRRSSARSTRARRARAARARARARVHLAAPAARPSLRGYETRPSTGRAARRNRRFAARADARRAPPATSATS